MRLIGVLFLLLALAEFAFGVYQHYVLADGPLLRTVGEFWFAVHKDSLQLAQPAIERHVLPGLWNWVILPVLTWRLLWVLLAIGLLLILLGRSRTRKRLMH